jgi:hypothetical protein
MKFNWKNLGFVFAPNNMNEKLFSHTTPVSPILLDNSIRVFYSPRTKSDSLGNSVSYISYVDLDRSDPRKILYIAQEPVMDLGSSGSFDEHGTMVAEVINVEGRLFMYYMGWQRSDSGSIPYKVKLGLAISDDQGKSFLRYSTFPLIDVDEIDPISIGNVAIRHEHGSWRMWYTSYTRWEFGGEKPTPEYEIKYATSLDGLKWEKTGIVCLEEDELGGVATPTLWFSIDNSYYLWYGYRKPFELDGTVGKYKIGFAHSYDGVEWQRKNGDFKFDSSGQDWDREMICYPALLPVGTKLYLFYCGNQFGKTGFGVAYTEIYDEARY